MASSEGSTCTTRSSSSSKRVWPAARSASDTTRKRWPTSSLARYPAASSTGPSTGPTRWKPICTTSASPWPNYSRPEPGAFWVVVVEPNSEQRLALRGRDEEFVGPLTADADVGGQRSGRQPDL